MIHNIQFNHTLELPEAVELKAKHINPFCENIFKLVNGKAFITSELVEVIMNNLPDTPKPQQIALIAFFVGYWTGRFGKEEKVS